MIVNGARSLYLIDTVKAIARNATTDYPVLMFYATIGDDICSQSKDLNHVSIQHNTRQKTLKLNFFFLR
jgi:hypothetical protein